MYSGQSSNPGASVKDLDLVDYLNQLGHHPVFSRGHEYSYQSPFRQETRPSFMVNRKTNVWMDFGLGKGGSIIDFCMIYFNLEFKEAVAVLRGQQHAPRPSAKPGLVKKLPATGIKIRAIVPLKHPKLIQYLRGRRVDIDLARQYCQEVHYSAGGGSYRAIGFRNDKGGYELRTPQWKGGNTPKWVRTYENGSYELCVFEGFMDFLSFLSDAPAKMRNYLVLNSLAFFDKMRVYMELHDRVFLFLDRDRSGRRHWHLARSWADHYADASSRYHGFKDLNDWRIHRGD